MMNRDRDPGDEELRVLFSGLRREEQAMTPRFAPGTRADREIHARGGTVAWQAGVAAAVCALVVAAFLWLRPVRQEHVTPPGRSPGIPVASVTEWRPPTDFLLNTPGREMLRAAPLVETRPYLGLEPARSRRSPVSPRRMSP